MPRPTGQRRSRSKRAPGSWTSRTDRLRRLGTRELAAALGRRLVFVDADTVVNDRVVAAAIQALDGGAVGGGAMVEFDGEIPPYAEVVLAATLWLFRRVRFAAGCFVYCTRDAFERAGGFDERYFGAEELVLSRAMKRLGDFVILSEAVTTSGRKVRAYSGWTLFKMTLSALCPRSEIGTGPQRDGTLVRRRTRWAGRLGHRRVLA